ncbi:ornithine carbamoyltransferase [Pseudonocardia nematodicida]|uniref:Ornithine carbamoyltransferase n=1 Tax=Pseudonocardia nematodicida TaxID=1206997 RepID=A0ABV1KDN8_9PSEU
MSFISLADVSRADIDKLVEVSIDVFRSSGSPSRKLDGAICGIYFSKTSTRTRTAFSTAALRLGAQLVTFGPSDLQTNTGESWPDTARTLGTMLDLIVIRTARPLAELREFAYESGVPVVNAMAAEEHPTQAIADLTVLRERLGSLNGITVSYVGEGNNTAAALALALCRYENTTLELCCPPGFDVPKRTIRQIEDLQCPSFQLRPLGSVAEIASHTDVIYTTRWQTTGTSKSDPLWWEKFRSYMVDDRLIADCPKAWFMHDLPANRGQEVMSAVIDGTRSLVWDQVQAKYSSAVAVLDRTLRG